MPTSPAIACPCGGRRRAGQACERCGRGGKREARRDHDRLRGNSTQRGYDYQWQQFRERYLAEHPLCFDCEAEGRVSAAVDVHHIVKLRERPDLKYIDSNLMSLCSEHHKKRTAKGE